MMKKICIVGLLFTGSTFAAPVVGDQASISVTIHGATSLMSSEVTAINSAGDAAAKYTSVLAGGAVVTYSGELSNAAQVFENFKIDHCGENNDQYRLSELVFVTVPAGIFQACLTTYKARTDSGELQVIRTWQSKEAPLFLVKEIVETNGSVAMERELVSYVKH